MLPCLQGPKDFLLEKDEANGKVQLSVDVGEYAEVSIYLIILKYIFLKSRRDSSLVALWCAMEAKKKWSGRILNPILLKFCHYLKVDRLRLIAYA